MLRLLTFGGVALESDEASAFIPRLRPPRLALLTVLAAAGERGCTRERLLGLFWAEAGEEHARHSLRQALYALRNESHLELVRTGPSLTLNSAVVTSDVAEFRAALHAGAKETAAALYRGAFLEGFYLQGAPEFERWVELERDQLARAAGEALESLARTAAARGEPAAAATWWHRLAQLEPMGDRVASEYIRALVASGDRAKALAFLRAHEVTVRRELDAEPDPSIRILEAELRGAGPSIAPPVISASQPPAARGHGPPVDLSEVVPLPARKARRGWPTARLLWAAGVLLAVGGGLALTAGHLRSASGRRPATTSAVARRFYEEGLRAFQTHDVPAARRLMSAALQEDSTFAMAAYYVAILTEGAAFDARQSALRLARRAPEWERLTITADMLLKDLEPGALAVAETLATKYPEDADAHSTLGAARASAGDWGGAVAALERAIHLRPAGGGPTPGCADCGDLYRLADTYFWWDSAPAADRTALRALARHPDEDFPWATRALAAARLGDSAAALRHLRRYLAATPTRADQSYELRVRLTLEQYKEVERLVLPLLASARREDADLGRWMLLIALRNQGRLAEAERLLRTGRVTGVPPLVVPGWADLTNEAQVAFERGNAGRAVSYFDALRRLDSWLRAPGLHARWMTWNTTLMATALAAAGDTAAVRRLADSVRQWGAKSLFGRDRRAHHYLRGLLRAAEGNDSAAVGEFRAAIHSPSLGYTRINYEMARSLLRLGRPQEAVRILQPALRGEIDAANLYLSRTELHELLARAFDQSGMPDSAAAHFRAVTRAWADADPMFVQRRRVAQWKGEKRRELDSIDVAMLILPGEDR